LALVTVTQRREEPTRSPIDPAHNSTAAGDHIFIDSIV